MHEGVDGETVSGGGRGGLFAGRMYCKGPGRNRLFKGAPARKPSATGVQGKRGLGDLLLRDITEGGRVPSPQEGGIL